MSDLLRRLLAGSTILRAPEDDDGYEADDELELPDDEPEDDEDEVDPDAVDDAEPDEDEEPPQRQPSRSESRVSRLAAERNVERERVAKLERELEDLKRRPASPAQPVETQEQFNARVNAMDPLERVQYIASLQVQGAQQQIARLQFTVEDTNDKVGFDSFVARTANASKFAAEVEQRRKEYLAQGTVVPRMDVLKHIMGERALESLNRSKTTAEKAAAVRRDRETVRPSSGRGDVGRESARDANSKSARDRRIENMKI
jgi:hypothetical protein